MSGNINVDKIDDEIRPQIANYLVGGERKYMDELS